MNVYATGFFAQAAVMLACIWLVSLVLVGVALLVHRRRERDRREALRRQFEADPDAYYARLNERVLHITRKEEGDGR